MKFPTALSILSSLAPGRNSFIDHGRGFGEAATAPLKYQKGTLSKGGLLAADAGERPDLAAQHPELVADRVSERETGWR